MELTCCTRYCLVAALVLTLAAQCHSSIIPQRRALIARSDDNATSADNVGEIRDINKAGWTPLLQCIFFADINKCLQDRTVRAIVGLDKDDVRVDANKGTIKLPGEPEEGLFDVLRDLMTDGIKRFFQDDGDEDDGDSALKSENGDNSIGSALSRTSSLDANTDVESGRGKKKKKKKEKKKAIIKLILIILLIKLKLAKLLYLFGKFLEFKFVTFIALNTIANLIRLFWEWKRKKEEKIVYSHDQSYHQHHYDEHNVEPYGGHDHPEDNKGWFDGIWSRTGSLTGGRGGAHDLAYRAQKPAYSTVPNSAQK